MILLATVASLFFTEPQPLEMPRATAYLVRDGNRAWLEDRYNKFDLWQSQTVDGRWIDEEDRVFTISTLAVEPPPEGSEDAVVTRSAYAKGLSPIGKKDKVRLRAAIAALSPVPIAEKGVAPHQLPRGFKDVDYWQGTNTSIIICAYLPEKASTWRLAMWSLAADDEYDDALKTFEHEFLDGEARERDVVATPRAAPKRKGAVATEFDRLRADAHHSITNYEDWQWTDAREFTILDDLPDNSDFRTALTNCLAVMRKRYLAVMPTPLEVTNNLNVARIFATRDEYLDAVDDDIKWSAACWCPQRRELIAYLPEDGYERLMGTIRHEAFHQYLSYAASMIPTSPWLNEGYAEYFEDEASTDWDLPNLRLSADVEKLAAAIRPLLAMDYEEFYDGSDAERRFKYRLAWSIAVFIEKGAPKVRFDPFKNLKRRYFESLLKDKDMRRATSAAFESEEKLALFIAEWKKFWLNM